VAAAPAVALVRNSCFEILRSKEFFPQAFGRDLSEEFFRKITGSAITGSGEVGVADRNGAGAGAGVDGGGGADGMVAGQRGNVWVAGAFLSRTAWDD
jgi:hypothetical protein